MVDIEIGWARSSGKGTARTRARSYVKRKVLMLKFMNHLLDRIFVLAGAFFGSQIPALMQQYSQRLAGHIEELQYQINLWHGMASSSNKTLQEYIHKFSQSSDADFSRHGSYMEAMTLRLSELSHSLVALQESSIVSRLFVFVSHINKDILESTLYAFVPQMALTIEGVCYTFIGLVVGYAAYQTLSKFITTGIAYIFRRT